MGSYFVGLDLHSRESIMRSSAISGSGRCVSAAAYAPTSVPPGQLLSSSVTRSQSRLPTPGNSPVDPFAIWRIRFRDEGS